MNSFEWKELQNLTTEIDTNQERLNDARSRRDVGRSQRLEEEIARAEKRRSELLAHITTHMVNNSASAGPFAVREPKIATPSEPADTENAMAPVVEAAPGEERTGATLAEPVAAEDDARQSAAAEDEMNSVPPVEMQPDPTELASELPIDQAPIEVAPAVTTMPEVANSGQWRRLTFSDITRARNELGLRRAEILARQAEELRALDTDREQLAALEQALESFTRKFKRQGGEAAAPIRLVEQPDPRQYAPKGKAA